MIYFTIVVWGMFILSRLHLNGLNSPEDAMKLHFSNISMISQLSFNNQISTGLLFLKPGFHYTANATTTTQKVSNYMVE